METFELGAMMLAIEPISLGLLITSIAGTAASIGSQIYQLANQEDPKEPELPSGFKSMSGQGDNNLMKRAAQAELKKKNRAVAGQVDYVGTDLDPYLTQQAVMPQVPWGQ